MKNKVRDMQQLVETEKEFSTVIAEDFFLSSFPAKRFYPETPVEKRERKFTTLVGLRARFNLSFRIKQTDELQVAVMLKENFEDNKYSINKCEFTGFRRIILCGVMIREAELVRVLLKQIKTYE